MKTLAENNMKQQVETAPVQHVGSTQAATIKLIDTTNIPQHNGKARKSLTRQPQVDSLTDDYVALQENGAQLNGKLTNGSRRERKQLSGDESDVQLANNCENLTASIVNKLNGHLPAAPTLRDEPDASAAPAPVPAQRFQRDAKLTKADKEAPSRPRPCPKAAPAEPATGADTGAAGAALSRPGAQPAGPKQEQAATAEIGLVKKLTIDFLLYLIKGLIATYDLISQPVCYFKHEVGRRRREVDQVRSLKLHPKDPDSAWRQVDIAPHQLELERRIDSYQTFDEMMRASYKENGSHPCYGYRQVTEERLSKRPDNPDKLIRQVSLSDYKWCTYSQFDSQIEAARRGLLREGVRAGQRVLLFADTRAEWQICSQALIRLGAIVGTMYSTLGVDGIIHTVNETQAQLIITQRDNVDRLMRLSARLAQLKKVIYFDASLYLPRELGGDAQDEARFVELAAGPNQLGLLNGVERTSFSKLLRSGLELAEAGEELAKLELDNNGDGKLARRTKDSLAVIMYTSGSTGIPKGVLISHGNIQATLKSFSYVTKDFICNARSNVCTAYLPLAHIFEFCIESVMLYHGVKFGFASPHTLTDKSPGLMAGQVGDLSKLQPTIMIIVPLILDRIVQGVKQALKAQSYFKEQLVSYLIDYKSYWQKRHYETPLVDKLICSKMAVALGGRAKYVICGSAPLSAQTQTFVRAALNLKLPQGFGTTETCAATACQLFDDQSTQNVGLPVSGAHIKLEAWPEANYRPDDKPNPRGEIVVGGEMIAHGYYNLEEQTKEAFYADEEGRRWYRTGDIGEFLPNGQLKIIDRKKDLVKLQNGEYVSLGRVESTLKSNPYTDNICVYANSNYNYVIALGPANEPAIRTLAQQIVEESERKLSPSMMKRLGGSQTALAEGEDERETLLMSKNERQMALAELKAALGSYETTDRPNGIDAEEPAPASGEQSRSRAGSRDSQAFLNERLNRLCANRLVCERVLSFICRMGRERNLLTLEIPKKIMLLAEEWTEDKNLVTAAMKIRRNFIYKRYEQELEQLYVQ